ncbi:unnamed protein product [Peronospora belbahrii]|uniref:Uncharacterized protein n=1 Tax=Peronospora belbahrii TaxID=622444 RepID=A0AAU9L2M1_9STRA|nr:unnamed protein product [Peronospora belbahrii]
MLRRSSKTFFTNAVRACGLRKASLDTTSFHQHIAGFTTIYDLQTPYEDINRHRSDAELRIAKVPIVELESSLAVCDGGGGALGHPAEKATMVATKVSKDS